MLKPTPVITRLSILCILLAGVAGCAAPGAQPTVPPTAVPTPTPPAGWQTYSASADQVGCGYVIDHPSDMAGASQTMYSWILNRTVAEPGGPVPNFVYISVIPADFPQSGSEPGAIYNYDPAETQTLLNMQVGESRSLREDPNLASWFTYTRLPDVAFGDQAAQTYENTQPWEFPPGTKEIRYYLQGNGCTYLIGGYMATVGSGQPGGIDEDLFDRILATFRLS